MSEILILTKAQGTMALGEMRTLARTFHSTLIHGYEADALICDIGKRALEFSDSILETRSPHRSAITAEEELRYAVIRMIQEDGREATERTLLQWIHSAKTVEEIMQ